MREIDAHFDAYEHLAYLPRANEALHTLRKAASIVKPIMRMRGWKVGTLSEFFPEEPALMGLNVNQTQRILLRLRHPGDASQFMPFEQVVDTLLHELSHIVRGPHDAIFHKLWNELRDEYQTLIARGYTGEGFLGDGKKLGGRRVPLEEMQRQARAAAEKRRTLSKGSGQRLGGRSVRLGEDMRKVIADAVTRRNQMATTSCGAGTKEGDRAAEQARRNGFRTKAEEDDANNLAISKALSELMEQEEERKLDEAELYKGDGSDGLSWNPKSGLQLDGPATPRQPKPTSQPAPKRSAPATATGPAQPRPVRNGRPVSRLVAEDNARRSGERSSIPSSRPPAPQYQANAESVSNSGMWACPVCTFENARDLPFCEMCETHRPPSSATNGQTPSINDRRQRSGNGAGPSSGSAPTQVNAAQPLGWVCGFCGTFMESKWWTCSFCNRMKTSS
ncbi:hypothetical protein H2201_000898 [Coniosporium apollinis]|uniref:WLM domain-containing protein n=1 Tax=Coniosporium apollinis TaxID=61459 RepID=A0ABQ9P3W7_9PEZI|nr:hypothetical protein H2201_000898 [Coniosporium apollinis]